MHKFAEHVQRSPCTMPQLRNAVEMAVAVAAAAVAAAVAVAVAVNEMLHWLLQDVAILCVPQQDTCDGETGRQTVRGSAYGHVAHIAHMAISSRSQRQQQRR